MALFWIAFVLSLITVGVFIYRFVLFKRERKINILSKNKIIEFCSLIAVFAITSLLCGYGIVLWNSYHLDGLHHFILIFGTVIFGASLFTLFECFIIYFYKPDLEAKQRKWVHRLMFIAIPFTVFFFVMSIEGYACYIPAGAFPLINGINFSGSGIKFITANNPGSGGFTITWYGLIILTGAVITYFVCDHYLYKDYHRHGIGDTLFIVVLIMGILGARIWYCFVLDPKASFWDFQSGGLAIMGGVLFGAVSGILFLVIFRRYINLRHAMDIILPAVLIAQAVGRWGNFFNQEVYGYMTFDPATVWWLPTLIRNQMIVSGVVHLPLFLIEFFTNLIGYFVIRYAIGKGLKKYLSNGDLFCSYIVWYGLTRVILEPLRASGFEYNASYVSAWVMFGGGLAAIIGLHIYDYFRWGKFTFYPSRMLSQKDARYLNPKNPYFKELNPKHEEIKN